MKIIVIIMGPIPTRWEGGSNRGGRRKRLDIGGDRIERTFPRRGGGLL